MRPRRSALLTPTLALLVSLASGGRVAAFEWRAEHPRERGMDAARLEALRDDLSRRRTKALVVVRGDGVVLEWYADGHGPDRRHYTASLAKALVGGMSLALALDDGRLRLDDRASKHIAAWRDDPVRSRITVRQLATHSSGIEDASAPETGKSHNELEGWKGDFWRGRSIDPTPENVERMRDPFTIAVHRATAREPGVAFAYSNPGMAALSWAVTASLREGDAPPIDVRSLLRDRIMRPIGVDDREWSIGYGRTYPVAGLPLVANWGGGGFTARAVARVGRLVLRRGDWDGRRIIGAAAIDAMVSYAGTPLPPRPPENPYPAPALGWYSNTDGVWPDVPRDAIAGAGAGNQVLLVVPSLDLIVVRNGGDIGDRARGEGFWRGLEKYLFEPVVEAVIERPEATGAPGSPPCPPSPVVRRIDWAPLASVRRRAPGGDNWPITWADDGELYTAYGDGRGFEPFAPRKLSMGFAVVRGGPDDFTGVNIRSPSGETIGDGPAGKKASGILSVGGVLWLWARNAGNSQLARSRDHGATWEWIDWKLTESFGAPTFLQFGRDLAGARDGHVYTYSFDSDDAYTAADRMVLARVPRDRIDERGAWEFFVRVDGDGAPVWSDDIAERGAVFEHAGRCYRSGISHVAALGRYFWVQVLPGSRTRAGRTRDLDPRFRGGFGVFDAPEPWGPWTTVYFTELWDTGPGETASFPTRWISEDGRTLHLVFSGNDSFSVRRAELVLRDRD